MKEEIKNNRTFMHCPSFADSMFESDQKNGVTPPAFDSTITGDFIELSAFEMTYENITLPSYIDLLDERRSRRVYSDEAITQEQLAFMLWSAGGIQRLSGPSTLRPVASGGARHPFDYYFAVTNVEGLEPGFYHYVPTKNIGEKKVTIERLGPLFDDYENNMNDLVVGQKWVTNAPVVLFVSCVPYRAEWRYSDASHRVMLIDLGHIGQNLMLSATAMGLGSCCIAAYDQKKCDDTFSFNGVDEYTVYVLPFGNLKEN